MWKTKPESENEATTMWRQRELFKAKVSQSIAIVDYE